MLRHLNFVFTLHAVTLTKNQKLAALQFAMILNMFSIVHAN